MTTKNNPISRKNELVIQEFSQEVLIYDLRTNKAFCLNETSAIVWQMCNGKTSVSEISQTISKKQNQPVSEDLVWLALDQLKKENLLEESQEFVSKFEGMSRREAVRKVGLGTMIALPVISSLIAPTAAMAQSAGVACATIGTICQCPGGTFAGATNRQCIAAVCGTAASNCRCTTTADAPGNSNDSGLCAVRLTGSA